jgi:hypothetical protein
MTITHPWRILFPKKFGTPLTQSIAIIIEGYQRSANSFSVNAFLLLQGDDPDLKVAYHLHAPTHMRQTLKLKVPILIVMRDPDGAILSQLMKAPFRDVRTAYKGYIDFYNCILPLLNKVVVATYDQVTTDFGALIEKLNDDYNTEFRLFEHTENNVQDVFPRLDDHVLKHHDVVRVDERKVAWPTRQKQNLKNVYQSIIIQEWLKMIRLEADALYLKILPTRKPVL